MKDPYEILGVTKSATDDEIKKRYRTLAKKFHPDLNPNNKEALAKFKELSVAYKLIENQQARTQFEKGHDGEMNDASFRNGPFNKDFQDTKGRYAYRFDGNVDDLFASFFSGINIDGTGMDFPGQDFQYTMHIDLKDAIIGIEKEFILDKSKRLKVKIPAGIQNKTKLRFKNQGGPGIGKGKPGDAYVEILIKPSTIFTINGSNLEIELPISLDEAVNGSKIKVPTIDSEIMLTIPPGVNAGSRLRIKGKGMPSDNGIRGDQIVIMKITLPKETDAEFREFIKKWSKDHSYNPRSKGRIKDGTKSDI